MRKTIFDLLDRKGKLPISMLTAYDYNTARTMDEAGIDMILVGDKFIRAVNCRNHRTVGADYILEPGDIIRIVANK